VAFLPVLWPNTSAARCSSLRLMYRFFPCMDAR
jgi:hypothetical protein